MYQFAPQPKEIDYQKLADYVATSQPEKQHPALWPQRRQVADGLRRLGREPQQQAARSAYHALRLFVW